MEVLPNYFQTKNFSSFLRQLSNYNFQKIKNKKGYYEYKHPKFWKGNFKEIKDLKKMMQRNPRKIQKVKNEICCLKKDYDDLFMKYEEEKNRLDEITSVNRTLVDRNKKLIVENYIKGDKNDIKLKKLLFCFYMSITYPEKRNEFKNSLDIIELKELLERRDQDTSFVPIYFKSLMEKLMNFFKSDSNFHKNSLNDQTDFFVNFLSQRLNKTGEINWNKIAENSFQFQQDYQIDALDRKEEGFRIHKSNSGSSHSNRLLSISLGEEAEKRSFVLSQRISNQSFGFPRIHRNNSEMGKDKYSERQSVISLGINSFDFYAKEKEEQN